MTIHSLLDNDLYKFTMQQAVLEKHYKADVTYKFNNRGPQKFTEQFWSTLQDGIENMSRLTLTDGEYAWLKEKVPFLKPLYLEYLRNFRFDPRQVKTGFIEDRFYMNIEGPWHQTILWEVPLMALVSRTYFHVCDRDWSTIGQEEQIRQKGIKLINGACTFTDFGTRRRRNYETQDMVVRHLKSVAQGAPNFVGTSNVHLAMKHGLKPIGTMAHEWIMGISALESLEHANRYAHRQWSEVYNASLGTALTDTFTTKPFWADFDLPLAKGYDGVRHDSGDPKKFGDEAIEHYNTLGIDPMTKTIIFSDGLNVDLAVALRLYFNGRIRVAFGIGTHFTNDFGSSKALNMVIKLRTVNGKEVIKLSDEPTKATGDSDALRVAKYVFLGESLDGKRVFDQRFADGTVLHPDGSTSKDGLKKEAK